LLLQSVDFPVTISEPRRGQLFVENIYIRHDAQKEHPKTCFDL
jgi:hypothetical protein